MQVSEEQIKAWPLAGYAPGNYHCKCAICETIFEGDKRAVMCLECAARSVNKRLQAAASVPPDSGVAVKALEWKGDHAPAVFNIEYQIIDNGNGFLVWINDDADGWQSDCDLSATKDEAKAAAQADYEARIRSALTPTITKNVTVAHPSKSYEDGVRVKPLDSAPSGDDALEPDEINVHEGAWALVIGTNGKPAGWIDTHELFAGQLYRDHLLPSTGAGK